MTAIVAGIITVLFGLIAVGLATLIFLVTGSIGLAAIIGLIFFGIARLLIAYFWFILILAVIGLIVYAFQNREVLGEKLKLHVEDQQAEFRQQAQAAKAEREERTRREEASEVPASELPHYKGGVVEETYEGEVIDAEEVDGPDR